MRLKIIAIFVVCIFFTLSILDTPEYVHCINLDLLDTSDLHVVVSNILKAEILSKFCDKTFENFISILENSIDNKEYFLSQIMLSDHIATIYGNSESEYPKHRFTFLFEENAVSEITKLIGISIIRS
ncbi:MAG: hypothetical protein ACMUIU_00115 [bacterium]